MAAVPPVVPPVAPVAPAAAAAPPAVVAPVTTSRELCDRPESDTRAGDCAAVLQASRAPATHADWVRAGKSRMALDNSVTTNACVGLFATPGSDPGRTRLLHAPRGPPAVIGRPTACDGQACASLDDVAAGAIQAVDSRGDFFDITPGVTISTTPAIGATLWAADPALTVIAPVTAAGQGRGVRVPHLMCVPPKCVCLLINRRLTPRQLTEEALVAVEADGDTADNDSLDDSRWAAKRIGGRPARLFGLVPGEPASLGGTDASKIGLGGGSFVPTKTSTTEDPCYDSSLWRQPTSRETQDSHRGASDPAGAMLDSDLGLAASTAQHDVIAHLSGVQGATIATLHDNSPTMRWQRGGSAATSGPAACLLRLQALHQRQYRHVPRHDPIPGKLGAVADAASRLSQLTDIRLLAFFDSNSPQERPWRLCALRSGMNLALTSSLSRARSEPESYLTGPERPIRCGSCGWNSAPATPWALSPPTTTLHRTSRSSLRGTVMDELHPAAGPFDPAQSRTPHVTSDRRTEAWGPRTSDWTPMGASTPD